MLEVHRTHRAEILNHSQVEEPLDRHGWSASKLWNVANYHSRKVWEEPGEIPGHGDLKGEECDAAFNADVNGAENIRLDINKSNSESAPRLGGDRSTGWLAQPGVYLHDLSSGFQPQEQVVDCKP